MGVKNKTTISKTQNNIMKTVLILSFLTQYLLASPHKRSSPIVFQNHKDAVKFLEKLRSERWSVDNLTIPGEFTTVEDWENFKDAIDEFPIPSEEMKGLEECTNKCGSNDDEWFGLFGNAYEENKETWQENGSIGEQPWPCQECCEKLPKTIFGRDSERKDRIMKFPKLARVCTPANPDHAKIMNIPMF